MDRRGFLRTGGVLGLGLMIGEQALEAFARLTHRRRYFPGHTFGGAAADFRDLHDVFTRAYGTSLSNLLVSDSELASLFDDFDRTPRSLFAPQPRLIVSHWSPSHATP